MRRARDKPEKEKSLKMPRESEFKLILRRLDRGNSRRKLLPSLSKLESREKTTCIKSKNKNKLSCKREKSRKIESKHSLIILIKSEDKLLKTRILRSKKDWITWKKAEKLEKKSTWNGKRSRIFNKVKYRILKMPE